LAFFNSFLETLALAGERSLVFGPADFCFGAAVCGLEAGAFFGAGFLAGALPPLSAPLANPVPAAAKTRTVAVKIAMSFFITEFPGWVSFILIRNQRAWRRYNAGTSVWANDGIGK
jgi:hypothetical protein